MAKINTISSDVRGLLIAAAVLVLIAVLVDDGTIGYLAGLPAVGLVVVAMFRMPLRHSMTGLTFLVHALPNPADGQPTGWNPPFSVVGQVLLVHLNTLDREGALGLLPVSLLEIFFALLFFIRWRRKARQSTIDGPMTPTPVPLLELAYVSLCTAAFTWISGAVRGGDFGMSLWQLNAVLYLPIVFLLMQYSLRGPEDYPPLAIAYLAAAVYKSGLAYYVVENITVAPDPMTGSTRPPFGTTHHDSMLFAFCFVILLVPLLVRPDRLSKRRAALLLPIITLGIVSNNRRLAWVQVAIVVIAAYLVSGENKVKRLLRRAAAMAAPVIAIYVAAGWNSMSGRLFQPVRTIRSVVDAETDASSLWREIENYDIVATFRMNPLVGTGYGHPYIEFIPLPPVNYPLEPFIPHNSLLGLWAYAGVIGFAGITLLWVAGVYFAMRAYHGATDPQHRIVAFVSFGAVPIYLVQSWGDLGLGTWTGMFMMATALTLGGKLAVRTGQWHGGRIFKRRA